MVSSPYPLLRVEDVKKIYQNQVVLAIQSLSFHEGKVYAIVGPNGSGKTTLIHILSLLDRPDEGKIFFKEREIEQIKKRERLFIRRQITLVHQKPFLFRTTVFNNIAYGLKIRGVSTAEREKIVKEMLRIVGLIGLESRKVEELSGGEAQRVVIARALALEPELLLLDEPTANIDKRYIEVIERIIKKINRERKTTIIFTTHDLSQAYRLADEIISLWEGKIVQDVPENIFRGKIILEKGLSWCQITEDIRFAVVSQKRGDAYIQIAPEDIILSYEPFYSSAKNSFMGKVVKISEQKKLVRIVIDIGVELVTIITQDSFRQMNINIGSNVFLTFKASAIKCY